MVKKATPPAVAHKVVPVFVLLLMSMATLSKSYDHFFLLYFGLNLGLVFTLLIEKNEKNTYFKFIKNGIMTLTPSLLCLITCDFSLLFLIFITMNIWINFAITGFVISKFYLAIENFSNFKIAFKHVFQGTLAAFLILAANTFGWALSGTSGYQAGCLNPYLPLTDPISITTRAL